MDDYEYQYGDEPEPNQKAAAYVQALQNQHSTILDNLISKHLLWSPEIFYPTAGTMGVIRTIVHLCDGRECDVVTFSTSGDTLVSEWRQT